jgi:hypothetical protein
MEETSVAGKQTSSRAQGTYLCSMQGKHVQDMDTREKASSRDMGVKLQRLVLQG